jgi:hypothetical protein
LSEYSAKKKQSPIIENQKQLVKGPETLTKKEQNTKSVGRRQINKSLHHNLNKQNAPVNITHLLKIH